MYTYIKVRVHTDTQYTLIHYRSADGVNGTVRAPQDALLAARVQAQHLATLFTQSPRVMLPPPQMPPHWWKLPYDEHADVKERMQGAQGRACPYAARARELWLD